MTFFKSSLLIAVMMFAHLSANAHGMASDAPPELAHFAKMMGSWATTEESLKPDGSGWQPSKGADWDFYWAFDGYGIRDYYVSPPAAQKVDDETKRQRGINLRVYNPAEKKWVMTWLTVGAAPPSGFTATSTQDQIVMLSDKPGPGGFHARITFFDMTSNSFEWKMERSKDQETWLEVYRIHGKRKAAGG